LSPVAEGHPEAVRTLGRLADALINKPVPPAKFLEPARTAWATITSHQRIALLETLIDAPFAVRGSSGERYLRALIFLSADLDPGVVGPLLTAYALRQCYVTSPGEGIRAEKVGNACLWALAAMPEGAGVPFLARILARTKYPKVRAKIDDKLNEAAAAIGLSRADLDELTVPTHDLDRKGQYIVGLPGGRAIIRTTGRRRVSTEWMTESGRVLKAPSATMRADKPGLKRIREAAKGIEADLGTLIFRLQHLYLEDRCWHAAEWRARYLDHPLVGTLARRLLWRIDTPGGQRLAALWDEDGAAMRDAAGTEVRLDGSTVRLWHPIESDESEVQAWRSRLEQLAIAQPFPQVWREVYAMTEAERATGTYSNRWAGHILKQHQAITLARRNGWRTAHLLIFDSCNESWHLLIGAHRLVVDFRVEAPAGANPPTNDDGIFRFVTTDRIQFHPVLGENLDNAYGPERGPPVSLDAIPLRVFSEVMRQADLLTAIASIAADPEWADHGDAWLPESFGGMAIRYRTQAQNAPLEESGRLRHAMLERIMPRLKIADRISLDERYLIVRGNVHTYRIHLGSAAAFVDRRHICIVPKTTNDGARLWLPFEGDRTLSIILSKALLLVADDKITDPIILAQL
jgi:hypothetical protein